ncbi:sensor histidine kinase [Catenulispora sp. NF23]|uniref:histidine kinase n=1 Tax=Catenulispora pinistramenti TaxID=2705254 RepID=A0ABS5L6F0_9ACTN|nr:sensor histidine kinase [Catenulispora pinistramenti]MBS2538720.1 sensor histidine kinase [Catenulispora pinistramenti]MBS2553774.1 sensor histidine kinase [Catenulispora pinistramenti]
MRRVSGRRLSSQIFVSQVSILLAVVLVGFGLFAVQERKQVDRQYMDEALQIAQTVADTPQVRTCIDFPSPNCDGTLQDIAYRLERDTKTDYVVIVDKNGIRHTHPETAERGQSIGEPLVTAPNVRIDHGSVGTSVNGRVPLYGPLGDQVGEVSVGRKVASVTPIFIGQLPVYAAWFGAALGVGALASYGLARRLKRRTFGLELDEIAKLLQEREAVLHGIREGMIAFDRAGRVTMVNDEARRLLGLPMFGGVGGFLEDVVPAGRLQDLLSGEIEGKDQVVLTDDYYLTVNRMPVTLAGKPHGAVVTLRDRTELSGLLRELDSVTSLTDALRAQQHEFSNRMHTVAGLLELGEPDEALRYLTDLSGAEAEFAESVRSRIAPSVLVGLILAKAAVAGERGVELELTEDTWLGDTPDKVQALTTILGNLVDNAFDAVSGPGVDPGAVPDSKSRGRVLVSIVEDDDGITVRVADNGPGIPVGAAERVFTDGFTTKPATGSMRRGLGLALVHRLVLRLGGSIAATEGPGAVFTVRLPKAAGDRGTSLSAGGGTRSV